MKKSKISYSDKQKIHIAQIIEFNHFFSAEKKKYGRNFRKIKCIREFCNGRDIKWKTFYPRLLIYQKTGKVPMPSKGRRPLAEGAFLNIIEPLLRHIKITGRSINAIHEDIISACDNKDIKPPSYFTSARIIKQLYPPDGKILSVKKYQQNYSVSLIINRNNPLEAIRQLAEFLQTHADDIPSQKAIDMLLNTCVYLSKIKGIRRIKPILLQQELNAEEISILEELKKSNSTRVRNRANCLLLANEKKIHY